MAVETELVPEPMIEQTAGSAPPGNASHTSVDSLLARYIPKELLARLEASSHSRTMEGERRVVTILFCDVQGSTLAASRLDPEEWAEIINGAFKHMIAPVYRYEGTVARLQGDGLLAFFGAPIAHEDDPQRAVLAGLEIVQACEAYGEDVKRDWRIDFNVRVGINTGLVVVGEVGSDLRVEYSALGDAINIASRMEQTAAAGSVQISEATRKLVAPIFDLETIESLAVKGREEPVTAYRVIREKVKPESLRGVTGLNSPLIGRDQPMKDLRAAYTELSLGSGQIVTIIAEAGLGKSRMVTEFHREVQADPSSSLLWLEGRSLSYEINTPFAPFIPLLQGFFELSGDEPDRDQYARVIDRLEALFPGQAEAIAPFISSMMGIELESEPAERVKFLEPPQLRGQVFAWFLALIERLAEDSPLVIYVDDLHWADSTSLDLLEALFPLTDRLPLMLIAAFRPRQQESSWKFHENASRDFSHRYHSIALTPLDQDQSRLLVANLLHVEDLPDTVRRKILEKSEGNPFFVEELIRSLLDASLIVRRDGHWQATQEIADVELPDTLAGVITARLDRLDDSARRILQAASVLGREFSLSLLAGLIEPDNSINSDLVELQRRGLIREKSRLPDAIYSFKHILTQEAAYSSILLSSRRTLHLRAAESLIQSAPDSTGEIARHLMEARQFGRALPYLVRAGQQAARAYATSEAIEYFQQALQHKSALQDPELERQIYEGLGGALAYANRLPEAQQVYEEMLAESERSADFPTQISALNKLGGLAGLRLGQFQEAELLLGRSEKLIHTHGVKSGYPEAALIRCQMCTAKADFDHAVEAMDEVVKIGNELNNQLHVSLGLEHVANSLVYMARFDDALEKALQGLEVSRESGNRESESWLHSLAIPICHIRCGDFEAARRSIHTGIEIGRRIGSVPPQAVGGYLLSELARWQGDYERALDFGSQALEAALPIEQYAPYMLVPALGSLGMVYLDISQRFEDRISEFHQHALRLLELPMGRMTGGTAWADLGFCAIQLDDLQIAEESFQQGLNYPNLFMYLERPRHLAGAALLACIKGDMDQSVRLIQESRQFAEERKMAHILPLISLVEGRILSATGDLAASLEVFDQAEKQAAELEMLPIQWQASAAAARILDQLEQQDDAKARRSTAERIVGEIAARFKDSTLRQAYLASATAKI